MGRGKKPFSKGGTACTRDPGQRNVLFGTINEGGDERTRSNRGGPWGGGITKGDGGEREVQRKKKKVSMRGSPKEKSFKEGKFLASELLLENPFPERSSSGSIHWGEGRRGSQGYKGRGGRASMERLGQGALQLWEHGGDKTPTKGEGRNQKPRRRFTYHQGTSEEFSGGGE